MHLTLTVPGPVPRKNRRHGLARGKAGKPRAFLSKSYTTWCGLLKTAATRWGRIEAGLWECRIRIFHSKIRHLDVKTPHIDVDAPISSVLDGLQRIGVLDDDVRIETVSATKRYDKTRPRIEVEMEWIST